jgi:hypothetical protein
MTMRPPHQTGFGTHSKRTADFDTGPTLVTRPCPRSLAALSRTHAIFTYSLLFLYGGLRHNPVQEYLNEEGLDRIVELMPLPVKLFRELHDPWGSILWTCPLEHWEGLMLHIGSTACMDRSKKWFARPVYQEFMVYDIAHAMNDPTTPSQVFSLSAFGVDASYGYCLFDPQEPLPRLIKLDPDPATVELASLLCAENADVSAIVRASNFEVFNVHPVSGSAPE